MDKNFPRLLDTLTILQRSGYLTTTQIRERLAARGHEVTQRTVQRDLEDLARVYPLECDTSLKPFSWKWRRQASRMSLPGMDWPEAVSFHLLGAYLDGVLPDSVKESIAPYLSEADRKLSQHFVNLPLKRWPERVRVLPSGMTFVAPKVSAEVHRAFTEAVLLGRRLKVRYKGFEQSKAKSYTLSPLGLVQNGVVLYAPVRFEDYEDVRTIALHRITHAEMLEAESGIDAFDLSAWIDSGVMGFGGDELIDLQVRLFDNVGVLLIEMPLAKDQCITEEAPGVHLIRATVRDTAQLRRWLLSQTPHLEVVSPSAMRQRIAESLRATLAHYA